MGNDIGSRIKDLLRLRGMTQKDLASRANITEAAVSHYIRGERQPRAITVSKIAEALSVSPADILGSRADMPSSVDNAVRLIARNAGSLSDAQRRQLFESIIKR